MENNEQQQNLNTKSDLIVITPDELAKLGLSPKIFNTSQSQALKATDNDTGKEKQSKKFVQSNQRIITEKNNSQPKTYSNTKKTHSHKRDEKTRPVVLNSKIVNIKNVNFDDMPVLSLEVGPTADKSMSSTFTGNVAPQILNNHLKFSQYNVHAKKVVNTKRIVSAELTRNDDERKFKEEVVSKMKDRRNLERSPDGNKSQDSNCVQVSASNSTKAIDFRKILQEGLSRKLRQLEQCCSLTDTTMEKINDSDESLKHASIDANKTVNITSNTFVHLSPEEIKRLMVTPYKNKESYVGNLFYQENNTIQDMKGIEESCDKESNVVDAKASAVSNLQVMEPMFNRDTEVDQYGKPEQDCIAKEEDVKTDADNERDDSTQIGDRFHESLDVDGNITNKDLDSSSEYRDTKFLIRENGTAHEQGTSHLRNLNQHFVAVNEHLTENNEVVGSILQNCKLPSTSHLSAEMEETNLDEAPLSVNRTSVTIPKKRKYHNNLPVEGGERAAEDEEMCRSINFGNVSANSCETKRGRKTKKPSSNCAPQTQDISCNNKPEDVGLRATFPLQDRFLISSNSSSKEDLDNEFKEGTEKTTNNFIAKGNEEGTVDSVEANRDVKENYESTGPGEVADIKLPKRRGRSKKVTKFEDNSNPLVPSPETSNLLQNLDDLASQSIQPQKAEVSNEFSDSDTGLPKKKGRQRISRKRDTEDVSLTATPNTGEIDEALSAFYKNELEPNAMVTSTPLPKKRGRRNKTEQPPEEVTVEDIVIDESRSGRKRRKVNYVDMVNEPETEIEGERKRRNRFSIQKYKKPVAVAAKQELEVKADENLTSCNESTEDIKQEEQSHNVEVESSTENLKVGKKKYKYNKTGETAAMMNSIFAAALKNKSKNIAEELEVDAMETTGEASTSSMITSKSLGRTRTSEEMARIVDKDNLVTCATCNDKLDNDDWATHNWKEHNNLAWREGESELILDNVATVTKALKPILKKDKAVKCERCKTACKTVSSFMNHMANCNGVISSDGLVTCAICKAKMEKTKWSQHKQRQHNNLAWRVGDRPLNLNDQTLVVNVLTALYRAKKPLHCEKCGTSKKSVIGFLSHQSQCGVRVEEVKIQCKFCDKKVLPVSMQSHVKMVHETPKESLDVLRDRLGDAEYTPPSLRRRKAAEMALTVINKFTGEKTVQENSNLYLRQANFADESFIEAYLKKELIDKETIRCKFDDCSYESDSAMDLIEHMNTCEFKPEEYYVCKKCVLVTHSEDNIISHLKHEHNMEIIDDDYQNAEYDVDAEDEVWEKYDLDVKRRAQHEKIKSTKDISYRVKPTCIIGIAKDPHQLFAGAYSYTLSFCKRNYSTERLFQNLRCYKSDWLLLDDNLIEEYLPLSAHSCDVARVKVNNTENVLGNEFVFKKFKFCETECDSGIATIFCGGPVHAMAWMPTPYTSKCKQVLALATTKWFDTKYLVNQQYNERTVIQFWDFGLLSNKKPWPEPKLMMCLTYDCGPVWHLEWCPSGCFDPDTNSGEIPRMGLLAVAGSDAVVSIYSIPYLKEDQTGNLIYKAKPLLKLTGSVSEDYFLFKQKFFTTRISWSKASGHHYIAVGYTDGMVRLFEVETTSALLKNVDKEDAEVILPFKTFQPHSHAVTVLELIHLNDGKRWLLTGSLDRNVVVWDLSNGFKTITSRNIITDGLWLTNWMAYITTYDESSTMSTVPTQLTSYRDYLYDRVSLTYSSSTVTSISESIWLNGIMYGNALGCITASFPPQLLYSVDNEKKIKSFMFTFGYTEVINKHQTAEERLAEEEQIKSCKPQKRKPQYSKHILESDSVQYSKYEPACYQEATEKYGLVFCDSKMDSFNDFTKDSSTKKHNDDASKSTLYPIQTINKVAFNPNLQASLYYAAGYQAGFVRVTYMKFLENDDQVK